MEYVVASYGVMLFALLIYLVVAAMKRARLAREAELLARLDSARRADDAARRPDAPAPAAGNLESVDS